jgi:peptide-methionine (S)-S-oxide reductase
VNSVSLVFHEKGQELPEAARPLKTATAYFAGGCFWGVEESFRTIPGVVDTSVGYMGGRTENPTYEDVCSDTTGHAETVLVRYDPDVVTYRELLDVFWKVHDPTTLNRQGPDVGSQYRSVIFYYSDEQKAEAQTSLYEAQKKLQRKIVTQVVEAPAFWKAEGYHQRYYQKRGIKGCAV